MYTIFRYVYMYTIVIYGTCTHYLYTCTSSQFTTDFCLFIDVLELK